MAGVNGLLRHQVVSRHGCKWSGDACGQQGVSRRCRIEEKKEQRTSPVQSVEQMTPAQTVVFGTSNTALYHSRAVDAEEVVLYLRRRQAGGVGGLASGLHQTVPDRGPSL